jgi:integrase
VEAPAKRQRLTDAICRKVPAPAKDKTIEYDRDVAGFGLRVTAAGARSFILRYRRKADGTERVLTVGTFPSWSANAAREEARRLRRLIDGGGDPLGEAREQRAAPTVADLADRFESEYLPRKRKSTQADYASMIRRHIRPELGKRKVASIEFADIDRVHRVVTARSGLYRGNRVVAVLSRMFVLAEAWRWRTGNPCKGIERNDEQKRVRYLTNAELDRLSKALAKHDDQDAADIFRLLLLTGARRGEVRAVRWADINLEKGVWTKPGSATKQRVDHVVPLNAPARELLAKRARTSDSQYVFVGRRGGHRVELKTNWRRICEAAKIDNLRVHDLRHSFASQLANSGASLQLIGAMLGHSSVETTARYSHLLDDNLRAAAERVGELVGKVASS